jgi:hypothetical protein
LFSCFCKGGLLGRTLKLGANKANRSRTEEMRSLFAELAVFAAAPLHSDRRHVLYSTE